MLFLWRLECSFTTRAGREGMATNQYSIEWKFGLRPILRYNHSSLRERAQRARRRKTFYPSMPASRSKRVLRAQFLLWLIVFFTPFSGSNADELPLKVGAILALTGNASAYGESIRNGMLLAQDELAAQKRRSVQIAFDDDQGKPSNTLSIFKRMSEDKQIALIVTMSAQPSLAVAPLADPLGLPVVAIAVPPKIVEGRRSVFLFFSTADRLAHMLVDEAARRGYRRIARISTIHDGRQTLKAKTDEYNEGRLVFAIDEDYPPEERDFRSFLAKVRGKKDLDGIYVNLFLGQIGLFAKQARDEGITLPLFTTEFFNDENERRIAGAALSGQWFIDQAQPDPEFSKRYKVRFGQAAALGSGNGYDLVMVLADMSKDGVPSRGVLAANLRNIHGFQGVLGLYSSTGDNRFDIPVGTKTLTFNKVSGSYRVEQIAERDREPERSLTPK